MKTQVYLIILIAILAASCTSLQQSTVKDDIYYSPKDEVVTQKVATVNTDYNKKESNINNQVLDNRISSVLEDDSKENVDTVVYESDDMNNQNSSLVVTDRDEAYQRRLDAMQSPYYGISAYNQVFLTDAYWLASAYDPYFYNVIIVGDQVWVEPRYITASYGFWPHRGYYSSFYYGGYYDPYYYGYSPYYYSYYSPYYSPYYNPYYSHSKNLYGVNDNYASSSFHSNRQRTLSTRSASRSSAERTSRQLPETYAGRDIRGSSTVKSGLDRETTRQSRTDGSLSRTRTSDIATPRVVRADSRTRTSSESTSNRNYTRPQSTSRSTYNAATRSTTRYNRPASSSTTKSTGVSSRSTYTPNRSATSSSRSGSSYSGRSGSSSRSTGSSSVRSSGSSSRSSGSSTRSSSGSSRSSGSSNRSSGSSSGGGRR